MKYLSTQKFCAYALLSLILIGCGDQAVTEHPVADASDSAAVTEAVTEPGWEENLPEVDMEGYNFRVLNAIWVEARSSFLPLFEAGKNTFASESEKVAKKINKQIDQYLEKVEKITDDLG